MAGNMGRPAGGINGAARSAAPGAPARRGAAPASPRRRAEGAGGAAPAK